MFRLFFGLALILLMINVDVARAKDITYMGLDEDRDTYHTDLLVEVFKHSSLQHDQVKRYNKALPHHRAFFFLGENRDIDIGYATQEREEAYRSVSIPILKGINGWRLSVVHKQNLNMFKDIKTLRALKKFTPGQFHSWTDFKILAENGFRPTPGSNFEGLYYMLQSKRFDYMPRSILEIHREVENMSGKFKDVVIEPHILLIYPTAFYLYVNKNNTVLADQLTQGLETIIANGIFDQVFYQHYADAIKRVEKQQRYVFTLDNPLLPENVPLERNELWLR